MLHLTINLVFSVLVGHVRESNGKINSIAATITQTTCSKVIMWIVDVNTHTYKHGLSLTFCFVVYINVTDIAT